MSEELHRKIQEEHSTPECWARARKAIENVLRQYVKDSLANFKRDFPTVNIEVRNAKGEEDVVGILTVGNRYVFYIGTLEDAFKFFKGQEAYWRAEMEVKNVEKV